MKALFPSKPACALWASLVASLLALSSCASAPLPAVSADAGGAVDFASIEHFSEVYRSVRYGTVPDIRASWARYYDELVVVDLPKTRNRYMIGTLRFDRRCEIIVRGTANAKNALYDVEFLKHRSEKLGINLHAGFEQMALALYEDILPRLDRGYALAIFGHSLGAAEAVILAMLLDSDGFRVARVYASGAPRVTDGEGEKKFDSLPIVRIINEGDPVPFLPPRGMPSATEPYMHLGKAVFLLDGPYYSLLEEDAGDRVMASEFWRDFAREGMLDRINDHFISAYIARLAPKLTGAIQVPYEEREKYMREPAR